jgi:hypothetical protein
MNRGNFGALVVYFGTKCNTLLIAVVQHAKWQGSRPCHRLKIKIETMHATMSAKGRPQTISLADVASTDGPRECERACDGYRLAASES